MPNLIPAEIIENKIYLIRGQKVMIDRDLAKLYGVKTFVLNQAVKRNIERFPGDFMLQLTSEESKFLRSQNVILNNNQNSASKRGKHTKYLPYAFSEQGIAMLSSVLRSKRAIQVNILIVRTFVKLRQILSTHKELDQKLKELELEVKDNSAKITAIFEAIQKLMEPPPETPEKMIGFLRD